MFKGLAFLLKFCWKFDKLYILFILANQIIVAAMPLATIVLPKYILDELVNGGRPCMLLFYIALLLGINFIGSILSNVFSGQAFLHKSRAFVQFQIYISEKMALADYAALEDPNFLDMREKANKFIFADGHGFAEVLDQAVGIIGQIFIFSGVIWIIWTLNPVIVVIFALLVTISSIIDAKVKKINSELNIQKAPYERRSNYFSNLLSDFTYGKEIRLWGIKDWLISKYRDQLDENQKFYRKSVKNNCKSFNFNAITVFSQQAIVYFYLCRLVLARLISIGTFSMYLNAVNTFSDTMKTFLEKIVEIQRFSVYYNALEEYMNVEQTMRSETASLCVEIEEFVIEFVHVSFKYPGQTEYALKDINLQITSGEKISIIGENGAGKTTFIKLLIRLYDPTEGNILLNGIDIRSIDYDEYLSIFATVFQDFRLLSLSIKDNISFGEKCDDSIIEQILLQCGLNDKFSSNLDEYIHKDFKASGIEPSGGEGQKLALARAIYRVYHNHAEIVVLDEPTAALDPRAEMEIYQQFNKIVCGKTAVFISHRLASSKFCDRVIVFKDGQLLESGPHEVLMQNHGVYYELYTLQSSLYSEAENGTD